MKIVLRRSSPIQGDPSGARYEQRIVRVIDLERDREWTGTRAGGGEGEMSSIELRVGNTVYTIRPQGRWIMAERPSGRTVPGPAWRAPTLGFTRGTESVAGKPCAVSDNGGGWRLWSWEGIALREIHETSFGEDVTEAVSVSVNPALEPGLLDPESYGRHTLPTGNPHDLCRLDRASGGNVTRTMDVEGEAGCRAFCDRYGEGNWSKGRLCTECYFEGRLVATYPSPLTADCRARGFDRAAVKAASPAPAPRVQAAQAAGGRTAKLVDRYRERGAAPMAPPRAPFDAAAREYARQAEPLQDPDGGFGARGRVLRVGTLKAFAPGPNPGAWEAVYQAHLNVGMAELRVEIDSGGNVIGQGLQGAYPRPEAYRRGPLSGGNRTPLDPPVRGCWSVAWSGIQHGSAASGYALDLRYAGTALRGEPPASLEAFAPAAGTVVGVEEDEALHPANMPGGGGASVSIRHRPGEVSVLGGLAPDSLAVKPGQAVIAGQFLGNLAEAFEGDPVLHYHMRSERGSRPGPGIPVFFSRARVAQKRGPELAARSLRPALGDAFCFP